MTTPDTSRWDKDIEQLLADQDEAARAADTERVEATALGALLVAAAVLVVAVIGRVLWQVATAHTSGAAVILAAAMVTAVAVGIFTATRDR